MHIRVSLVTVGALVTVLATLTSLSISSALHSDGTVIEIPLDSVHRGDPGTRTTIATFPVPDELVGNECTTIEARAENNSSVHPENDLVLVSGSDHINLPDVEEYAGKITTASGALLLGTEIEVVLVMGPDKIFSGGADAEIVLACPDVASSTTTTTEDVSVSPSSIPPTSSSTSVAPTSAPPTPSTALPTPTSTVPPEVLPTVQVASPAQATGGTPSFTG